MEQTHTSLMFRIYLLFSFCCTNPIGVQNLTSSDFSANPKTQGNWPAPGLVARQATPTAPASAASWGPAGWQPLASLSGLLSTAPHHVFPQKRQLLSTEVLLSLRGQQSAAAVSHQLLQAGAGWGRHQLLTSSLRAEPGPVRQALFTVPQHHMGHEAGRAFFLSPSTIETQSTLSLPVPAARCPPARPCFPPLPFPQPAPHPLQYKTLQGPHGSSIFFPWQYSI